MATLDEVSARMIEGDNRAGEEIFQRIAHLAVVSDGQQQLMFQSLRLLPQDARDFLAYLSSQGATVEAVPVEEGETAGCTGIGC